MTTIPDDTDRSSAGDRPHVARRVEEAAERAQDASDTVANRVENAAERTQDASKRIAAAIAGALEGFVEALDRYDLGNEGRRAVENAGAVTRATAVEAKTQAASPEMQQVKRGVQAVGAKVSDMAHSAGSTAAGAGHTVGDAAGDATHAIGQKASDLRHSVAGTAHSTADAVRDKAHDIQHGVREGVESAKYAAYRAKENVKVRAEAVAETGRRARIAPGHIVQELGEAFSAWKRALVVTVTMMAALIIFATIALIVLTIALVVGLNAVLGDPAGTFVVALLYLVIGGIAYAVSRSAKTKAAREREERMENVREEVRHVVRPVRDAFGGRGRTY